MIELNKIIFQIISDHNLEVQNNHCDAAAFFFACCWSRYPVTLAHHIFVCLQVCSVHIGQVINIWGFTVSPAMKSILEKLWV